MDTFYEELQKMRDKLPADALELLLSNAMCFENGYISAIRDITKIAATSDTLTSADVLRLVTASNERTKQISEGALPKMPTGNK